MEPVEGTGDDAETQDARYAEYWAALSAADRPRALAVVKELHGAGVPGAEIIDRLIVPSQARIGELWLAGEWSVDQEHAVTGINEGLVHWLGSFAPPAAQGAPHVVVACGESEQHALPALVVAERLTQLGLRVTYLGPVPDPADLLRQILRARPRAVLLSASLTSSLAPQKALIADLRAAGLAVVVGGGAFGEDAARAAALGATAYAADADEAARVVRALPRRQPPLEREPVTPADLEARWLLDQRPVLVDGVARRLLARHVGADGRPPRWWVDLEQHLTHVVGSLAAALVTGDETITVEVRGWLSHVVGVRGGDPEVVGHLWDLLAEPLRGHPLARAHLAAAGTDSVHREPAGDDLEAVERTPGTGPQAG